MINNALKMAGEPSLVLGIFCAANGVWPILNISDSRVVIAVHSNAE
ncbi:MULTISPECIES: hypothetical protein [Pseudomonas]|jgi:hypothetical protein|nr:MULTISPECIES: hypothetical protein [Pseudomonas]MDR7023511.1 hypothetical protein [Pseudomonas peli]|tara:strand:- start:16096 stop:16233 length:138 start_codon:yes stop_codon:yes gene_type:complete